MGTLLTSTSPAGERTTSTTNSRPSPQPSSSRPLRFSDSCVKTRLLNRISEPEADAALLKGMRSGHRVVEPLSQYTKDSRPMGSSVQSNADDASRHSCLAEAPARIAIFSGVRVKELRH